MYLDNRPPALVPAEYRDELERLSKAALMDMAWDLARWASNAAQYDHEAIMREIRRSAGWVLTNRDAALSTANS